MSSSILYAEFTPRGRSAEGPLPHDTCRTGSPGHIVFLQLHVCVCVYIYIYIYTYLSYDILFDILLYIM